MMTDKDNDGREDDDNDCLWEPHIIGDIWGREHSEETYSHYLNYDSNDGHHDYANDCNGNRLDYNYESWTQNL